jgi:hypothetical protein
MDMTSGTGIISDWRWTEFETGVRHDFCLEENRN